MKTTTIWLAGHLVGFYVMTKQEFFSFVDENCKHVNKNYLHSLNDEELYEFAYNDFSTIIE